MVAGKKSKRQIEFGDFQTPIELAREVCSLLSRRGLSPTSVLEPTCGEGRFLIAAIETFPTITNAVGLEIIQDYADRARQVLERTPRTTVPRVIHDDFFAVDWPRILGLLPDPILIIGNPPWVTNSALGGMGSDNLPEKSNFQKRRGIDAITGKGNFDISEWMLIKAMEWIRGRRATLAMLCKSAVARKVLLHGLKDGQWLEGTDIYHIDASRYFGANVDACLLVISSSTSTQSFDCQVHDTLDDTQPPAGIIGYRNGRLIADVPAYQRWKHLEGEEYYKWRSGIKHDCSKVMELRKEGGSYRNGFGELVELEPDYLYPMLKSSDIIKTVEHPLSRWMLVPQRFVGEDTGHIEELAPQTWEYLTKHAHLLDRRASSIYKNQPRFSVFGVGSYSFAPWKVAISGLYKQLAFRVVRPFGDKPTVLDDTCYLIPCQTEEEALYLAQLLNSEVAKAFFSAFIFWDAKRPVTVELLRRLDFLALAQELDLEQQPPLYPGKALKYLGNILVLQRQFREGCGVMPAWRRGAWHGSVWPVRYCPAYPQATAATRLARTVPGAAFPAPPGRPAAS